MNIQAKILVDVYKKPNFYYSSSAWFFYTLAYHILRYFVFPKSIRSHRYLAKKKFLTISRSLLMSVAIVNGLSGNDYQLQGDWLEFCRDSSCKSNQLLNGNKPGALKIQDGSKPMAGNASSKLNGADPLFYKICDFSKLI
jgi:hypothetical protein